MMPKQKQKSRGSVRSLFLSAVILAICVILAACGEPQSSCSEELDALLAGAPRPAGVTYICGALEGEASYLSAETARALYGEDAEAVFAHGRQSLALRQTAELNQRFQFRHDPFIHIFLLTHTPLSSKFCIICIIK